MAGHRDRFSCYRVCTEPEKGVCSRTKRRRDLVDAVKVYAFWLATAGAAMALRAKAIPAMDTTRLVKVFTFQPLLMFVFS